MTTCRYHGCRRMVSRDRYCRPHFITESLGWTITSKALRSVPFGLLSEAELNQLRRETKGEEGDTRILNALRRIAPGVMVEDPIAEEEHEAEPYDPTPIPMGIAMELALTEQDQGVAAYDPIEAMRRDMLGLTDDTEGLLS